MSQRTITINGRRYTGNEIDSLMQSTDYITQIGHYHIYLNGVGFYARYREPSDGYYAPVCQRERAGYIELQEGERGFLPLGREVLIEFDPGAIKRAATVLGKRGGSKTSERKAAAARENGRKGGRPRKSMESRVI